MSSPSSGEYSIEYHRRVFPCSVRIHYASPRAPVVFKVEEKSYQTSTLGLAHDLTPSKVFKQLVLLPIEMGPLYPERNQRIAAWAHAAAVASDPPAPTDPEARNLHDQENAQRIEHQDLHCEDKQVCTLCPEYMTYSSLVLLWLAWQSTGVVYGYIGTSPLYVFSSTFAQQPTWHDLVGALSIIIWSLTLIVTIKYCFIVLSADDGGHGGTFAVYTLLARHARIVRTDPNGPRSLIDGLDRRTDTELSRAGRCLRNFIETSRGAKIGLKLIGIMGVSMTLADSVLAPAQSVLGAVQGIQVVSPELGRPAIVGVTCSILVLLFLLQPLGTSKIGTFFAPIVLIWLLFNLGVGIYNFIEYDHTVLKAFSPYFAFAYLYGSNGWKSLSGLLLAITGVESLFAALGAFGKRAIQLSWLLIAYPSLLLAYAGQAAYISVDETGIAFTNPFFYTVPRPTLYFSVVIAVLAAIVASQAMITSSFQLISQLIRLSYFPHIKIIYTSRRFRGHVYMPFANWLLMIGTVVITTIYNNTTSLGYAYGTCAITVCFLITCMVSLVALIIWRVHLLIVLLIFLVFILLDGVYLSAALSKVPQGAWFALVLSFLLSALLSLWRWGKEQQWAAECQDRIIPPERPVSQNSSHDISRASSRNIRDNSSACQLAYDNILFAPGLGIFFDKVGGPSDHIPEVFTQFVHKFRTRPQVVIFFHMRSLSQPTIPADQRFVIARVNSNIPSCYHIVLRHGYMDDVLTSNLTRIVIVELMMFIMRDSFEPSEDELPSDIRQELESLRAAEDTQTVYLIGKQILRVQKKDGNCIKCLMRRGALGAYLWIRENFNGRLANLDIDPESLVEVGFIKEI
ncbi:Vegetative incompatibility protein HET-E-1 [Fusarium oxysporum f. sp. albedinis]|nr:Vegetative incompatibility protein HET-E-1 [Fusarium oxysporum f. sp. albedinis]